MNFKVRTLRGENLKKIKLNEIADVFLGIGIQRYKSKEIEGSIREKVYLQRIDENSNDLLYESIYLKENIDKKFFSKKNDLLIKLFSPKMVYKVTEENIIVPSKFAIIRVNENISDVSYIYHILNSRYVRKQIVKLLEGKFKTIKIQDIKDLELIMPSVDNQRKFAELFNLIDQKINLENEKISNYKKLKDGFFNEMIDGDLNEL